MFISIALLQGCAAWSYGVEATNPPPNKLFSSKVNSLTPTFRWNYYKPNKSGSNISYDFQILTHPSKQVVYERYSITVTNHKIDSKLKPNTKYYWQVRGNYSENGNMLVTEWNGWTGFVFLIMGTVTAYEPFIYYS